MASGGQASPALVDLDTPLQPGEEIANTSSTKPFGKGNEASDVAIVVIGRNEGALLERSLRACTSASSTTIYADSGSSDESMIIAERLGVMAIALSPSKPFTAARGRNEGFERATKVVPGIKFVQFVDGDCELHPDWINTARDFLLKNPNVGIVCGQLHERFPERSIYNRLCEAEWKRPPGETGACGGIFMARAAVYEAAGGFDESISAGEEYDLCLRVRRTGWAVWRLAGGMATHDAALYRLSDWWERMARTGRVAAAGAIRYSGDDAAPHRQKCLSTMAWAIAIPACIMLLILIDGKFAILLAIYPIRILRWLSKGYPATFKNDYAGATLLMIGTLAEFQGIIYEFSRRLLLKLKTRVML
jgi:GT2 family glycosyltransferase